MEKEMMEAVASIVCAKVLVIDSSCPSSTRTEDPTEDSTASCCPGSKEEPVNDADGGHALVPFCVKS